MTPFESPFSLPFSRTNVISTDSNNISKNTSFFVDYIIDFFTFITKPRCCKRKVTVFLLIIILPEFSRELKNELSKILLLY